MRMNETAAIGTRQVVGTLLPSDHDVRNLRKRVSTIAIAIADSLEVNRTGRAAFGDPLS